MTPSLPVLRECERLHIYTICMWVYTSVYNLYGIAIESVALSSSYNDGLCEEIMVIGVAITLTNMSMYVI